MDGQGTARRRSQRGPGTSSTSSGGQEAAIDRDPRHEVDETSDIFTLSDLTGYDLIVLGWNNA